MHSSIIITIMLSFIIIQIVFDETSNSSLVMMKIPPQALPTWRFRVLPLTKLMVTFLARPSLLSLLSLLPQVSAAADAAAPSECSSSQQVRLARAVRAAWRCHLLPLGGPPGSFKGVNEKVGAGAPKRDWRNGSVSNSLARQVRSGG